MKAVAQRRDELKRRSRQALATGAGGLRHTDEGFQKDIVERLNLIKLLEDPKVVDKLAQAGFRGPKPLTRFYFFRFTMPEMRKRSMIHQIMPMKQPQRIQRRIFFTGCPR